jgi:hypothetical protein
MKAKKITTKKTKAVKTAPLKITEELSTAKTISATRRAITILKLLGSHRYILNSKKALTHRLPPRASVMTASFVVAIGVITIAASYGQWSNASIPNSLQNITQQGTLLTFDFSFLNPKNVIAELKDKAKNELAILNQGLSLFNISWPNNNFTVAYTNNNEQKDQSPELSWTTSHVSKISRLANLNNDSTGQVLSANTTKIITDPPIENSGTIVDTTSTAELTSPPYDSNNQAPWISSFSSASAALKEAINSNNDKIAHAMHDAFYSATGIFNNLYAREVHTDLLCVGKTCVTEEQFIQMVQQSQKNTAIETSVLKQEDKSVAVTSDSNKWSRINRAVR